MKRICILAVVFPLIGCTREEFIERAPQPAAARPAPAEPAAAIAPITTRTLLADMTSLRRLAELPSPSYTTRQFSSYDRKSTTPNDPTESNWFANGDWGQFIRIEDKDGRKEHVMADMAGPGVIVRIWSANPKGKIRIYIDGSDQPAIETEMTKLLGGQYPGLPKPIAGERSKGWNLYFPIAYARHAKVTSDEGGFYYHVNYRTYPAGTPMESFKPGDLTSLKAEIAAANKLLRSPRIAGVPPTERENLVFNVTINPGEEKVLSEVLGSRAIVVFKTSIEANDVDAAARATILQMGFDGQQTVTCPIGDFFGMAPGLIPYASLPLGVSDRTEDGKPELWSHWWMPFSEGAIISARNLGETKVTLKGAAAHVPWQWTDRSLLFNAGWRIERDVPSRPFTDWAHLEAAGQGRFVGGALHIINTVRGWWGEGDEKIYVDGERFPSHFGTGTEDYYGYAWCSPERFVHAYHNQPRCQGPGNYGNTSVNRFHILDDIPFTKSIKFDIENWHGVPSPRARTTRAAVSYWYARPESKHFFKPITKSDVRLDAVPEFKPLVVKGAIEGEKMKVIEKTATVEPQALGEEYSNDQHLWWRDGKPGDKLVLGFESPEAGSKHVIVRLTKARDYGIVQLYVNGQKAGQPIDLYNDGVRPTDRIDLGAFDLKKGENTLTVEITGANEKAEKRHMFGIDYVLLQ